MGLTTEEYAAAIFGRQAAFPLVRFLTAAALAYCRRHLHLVAQSVRLCGHPWVPADLDLPWVAIHDWRQVCLAGEVEGSPLVPGTLVVRLDPWECRVTTDLHGTEQALRIPSAGAALVRLLLEAWEPLGRCRIRLAGYNLLVRAFLSIIAGGRTMPGSGCNRVAGGTGPQPGERSWPRARRSGCWRMP